MSYELVDVDRRHRESPESFGIPSLKRRKGAKVGTLVKLIFEFPDGQRGKLPPELHGKSCPCCGGKATADSDASGERMWVEVTERHETSDSFRFRGILRNRPVVFLGSLAFGDTIDFGPEHIASADHPAAGI